MPWSTLSMSALREEFVRLALSEGANVRSLCRRYGVSAKTGYKWLERFKLEGVHGLEDRSRRPAFSPSRSEKATEEAVLEVRQAHPAWGGRKIAEALERRGVAAPSPSTVTAILRRHGVAIGALGGGAAAFARFEHEEPNDLWQMDFKGHVAMRRGRLHPLTVLDDHSRFSIVLAACPDQTTDTVKVHLIKAFRRYGLPVRIITDNGSPWGDGPGSPFTPLGVFLIEQGVRIAHAKPYHPQTLGKDERFHRSLKAEALSGPPFETMEEAAQKLERWRHVYNSERPHEALGMKVPIERYRTSLRPFREIVEPFDYAPDDLVRRVQQGGWISFKGCALRVPKAFKGKQIALRPNAEDGLFDVVFRHQKIKTIDIRTDANHV
jgi:transposase InsO family protein